jgi:hypothetical protein
VHIGVAVSGQKKKKKKPIHVVSKTHYSPHLAPCNVFFFPQLKCSLKGTNFQSIQDIQKSVTE